MNATVTAIRPTVSLVKRPRVSLVKRPIVSLVKRGGAHRSADQSDHFGAVRRDAFGYPCQGRHAATIVWGEGLYLVWVNDSGTVVRTVVYSHGGRSTTPIEFCAN